MRLHCEKNRSTSYPYPGLCFPPAAPVAGTLLCLAILFLFAASAGACSIKLTLEEDAPANYAVGDTLVVVNTMMFTHGNCLVDIRDTQYKTNGIEILGATAWKEIKSRPRIMQRKLKIVLTGAAEGDVMIKAYRICDIRGGEVSLVLIPAKAPQGKE
ncbi:MAG: hypothetical protein JXB45_11000 [Candidatus Krumholzibacteriota bacterium]|nr:hypothetical protein [Candidatus Krumholzibacteriota bacterium]